MVGEKKAEESWKGEALSFFFAAVPTSASAAPASKEEEEEGEWGEKGSAVIRFFSFFHDYSHASELVGGGGRFFSPRSSPIIVSSGFLPPPFRCCMGIVTEAEGGKRKGKLWMEKSFIFLLLSYILPFSASSHSCAISHCNAQSRTSFNAQHHSAAILAEGGMRRQRQSSTPPLPFPPPRPHCALTRNQLYYTYHIPPPFLLPLLLFSLAASATDVAARFERRIGGRIAVGDREREEEGGREGRSSSNDGVKR